jgi:hypothetical protein
METDAAPIHPREIQHRLEGDGEMNQPNKSIPAVSAGSQGGERTKRTRRPLPAIEVRDWLTAEETGAVLGCSVATVHRLRRGLIAGVAVLPAVAVGTRKYTFRKASVTRWQDQNEKGRCENC